MLMLIDMDINRDINMLINSRFCRNARGKSGICCFCRMQSGKSGICFTFPGSCPKQQNPA